MRDLLEGIGYGLIIVAIFIVSFFFGGMLAQYNKQDCYQCPEDYVRVTYTTKTLFFPTKKESLCISPELSIACILGDEETTEKCRKINNFLDETWVD